MVKGNFGHDNPGRIPGHSVFLFLICLLTSFQLLGCKLSIDGLDGSQFSSASSGHGQGYDGMRSLDSAFGGSYDPNAGVGGRYLRIVPGHTCEGRLSHAGRIWHDGTQFMFAKDSCSEDAPQPVLDRLINQVPYNPEIIGYEGGLYQRFEFAPNLADLTSELVLFCRYQDYSGSGIDVLIRRNLANGNYQSEVIQGEEIEPNVFQKKLVAPFPVSPIGGYYPGFSSGAYYFDLMIQYYNPTAGSLRGNLEMVVDRLMFARSVDCYEGRPGSFGGPGFDGKVGSGSGSGSTIVIGGSGSNVIIVGSGREGFVVGKPESAAE
ncbi:MAG: hypothetical protein H6624_02835 [Bdellovibrionaceae bacterium]|nr:hypothetical protein [Bdellovibrionales bacterium]MCB9083248.1 hypothetical protein [Pseudobdellovibrionaceae bacterium]